MTAPNRAFRQGQRVRHDMFGECIVTYIPKSAPTRMSVETSAGIRLEVSVFRCKEIGEDGK